MSEKVIVKEQLVRVECKLCRTPLVIKKVDMGTRYKYELLCPYCGNYSVWFEEKKVVKSGAKGNKKHAS